MSLRKRLERLLVGSEWTEERGDVTEYEGGGSVVGPIERCKTCTSKA